MRRLLILRGGALGDFLVTLPALALLRRRLRRSLRIKGFKASLAMRCRLKKILNTKLNLVTVAAAPLSPHTIISAFSHFY